MLVSCAINSDASASATRSTFVARLRKTVRFRSEGLMHVAYILPSIHRPAVTRISSRVVVQVKWNDLAHNSKILHGYTATISACRTFGATEECTCSPSSPDRQIVESLHASTFRILPQLRARLLERTPRIAGRLVYTFWCARQHRNIDTSLAFSTPRVDSFSKAAFISQIFKRAC